MAFNDLYPNQMVTFEDAKTGGFVLKSGQTNPGGTQCITKDKAFELFDLASNAGTDSILGNQLMQKSFWENRDSLDISITFTVEETLYYEMLIGIDPVTNKGHYVSGIKYVVSRVYPPNINSVIYNNPELTERFNGNPNDGFHYNLNPIISNFSGMIGNEKYRIDSNGVIREVTKIFT